MLEGIRAHTDHEVELLKLPSPERNLRELISSYRRFADLDLNHFDMVISTKYPAWMVQHWNHVVYLQHRLRGQLVREEVHGTVTVQSQESTCSASLTCR